MYQYHLIHPSQKVSQRQSKPIKLYQQLLLDNYPGGPIYQEPSHKQHVVPIKFINQESTPYKLARQNASIFDKNRSAAQNNRNHPQKATFQVTSSLIQNFPIVQIQNQSYSTLNMASKSRHHLDDDQQILFKTQTSQSNYPFEINQQQNLRYLLEDSSNHSKKQEVLSPAPSSQKIKQYKSYQQVLPLNINDAEKYENEHHNKLSQKNMHSDFTRKISHSLNNEQEKAHLKIIFNHKQFDLKCKKQEHTPQKSVREDFSQNTREYKQKGVTQSLLLNNSIKSDENHSKTNQKMYFSTHVQQNQSSNLVISYTPHLFKSDKVRQAPKSQPKNSCNYYQKSTRSNSIQCKSKPILNTTKNQNTNSNVQLNRQVKLDISKVTKIFKQQNEHELVNVQGISSIQYEASTITICCGSNNDRQSKANRINYMNPEHNLIMQNGQNIEQYKINSIRTIKKHSDRQRSDQQNEGMREKKKGLRLIGFPHNFTRQ